jgi:hypothetical protein
MKSQNMRSFRGIVATLAAAVVMLGANAARAQSTPAPEPYRAPERPVSYGRVHDGFYLRMALGGSGMAFREGADTFRAYDASVRGGGWASELSIGGTPARGLVLAGSFFSHSFPAPTITVTEGGTRYASNQLTLGIAGLTLDWYPNPRGGFHVGGTLGFAGKGAYESDGKRIEGTARGGGAWALAMGYDAWIAREWSFGLLARYTGVAVWGTETVDGSERLVNERGGTFALMATVLYH